MKQKLVRRIVHWVLCHDLEFVSVRTIRDLSSLEVIIHRTLLSGSLVVDVGCLIAGVRVSYPGSNETWWCLLRAYRICW